MRRMYRRIEDWMATELKISGNELLVYGLIYGSHNQTYTWSKCNLAKLVGANRTTITRTLKKLIKLGLIEETEKGFKTVAKCSESDANCNIPDDANCNKNDAKCNTGKNDDDANCNIEGCKMQHGMMQNASESDAKCNTYTNNIQITNNSVLYEIYPYKSKGINKAECDKLITKQLKQGSTLEGMLKEMKLEGLELRIKEGTSYRYGKKLENRLKEYVEGMADDEERLKKLLLEHRKRLESGPPYRKNPRNELCELFGSDYVNSLFKSTKQGIKLFTY